MTKIKSCDEENLTKAFAESRRLVQADNKCVKWFMASELEIRTCRVHLRVFRDCCVKAWGLFEPKSGGFYRNLSGTAGKKF